MKAAEGGYVRAMYNVSLCYKFEEGLARSHRQARKWMKRAADRGHSKAQYEHGLTLFSVCIIYCTREVIVLVGATGLIVGPNNLAARSHYSALYDMW